ncbi:MAG: universal stress protein [Hyphomicrobiaceae bacterium]|nr:universal stress protein [Hyphomicrobiaceae bacterium]
MYKHILIATDGSELAHKAVAQGLSLAKALGSKVTIVTVTEPWTAVVPGEMGMAFPVDDYEKTAADSAAGILAAVRKEAESSGVACEVVHMADQYPAEGIITTAKSKGADLIVMASHGRRGLSRLLIGSQTNQVVVHSEIPVLVVR